MKSPGQRPATIVEYEGKKMNLRELASKIGVPSHVLSGRLKKGMSLPEAIAMPYKPRGGREPR